MLDLIAGLIDPCEGELRGDDEVIDDNNRRSWHALIGYVPQQIYLCDDTIAANIALGMDDRLIDIDRLEMVAKVAGLHDFVIEKFPSKYDTVVGENGAVLSGGQRQRIGIARALYHEPKLLILDEATNALDTQMEAEVVRRIIDHCDGVTVIMVSHSLNSLACCDRVVVIKDGAVALEGTYAEVCNKG